MDSMKQQAKAAEPSGVGGCGVARKRRVTRRERFLSEMEQVVPWARLEALIEPHYPTSGRVGRPPIGVARMLRMPRRTFIAKMKRHGLARPPLCA